MRSILFVLLVCVSLSHAQNEVSKKGLAYGQWATQSANKIWNAEKSPLNWYYNFKVHPSSGIDDWKLQFVPMMWGDKGNDLNFYDDVMSMVKSGMNISYVLGFNEPDICSGGGSCIQAPVAAEAWKKHIEPLKKHGIKLGAPAVTGGNFVWLQEFYTACDGGCSTDFIPLHFYSDVIGLSEWVQNITHIYQNMTIWVTEFGCPDCSLDVAQIAFNESIAFLDKQKSVTHYSYFGSFRADQSNTFLGPNVAMLDNEGGLTDIGTWYLDLPASDVGKTNIGPAPPKPPKSSPSESGGSGERSGIRGSGANVSMACTSFLCWWQVLVVTAAFCIAVSFG